MSRLPRPLKVRRTDFRPPTAGTPSPLERGPARPGTAVWDAYNAKEQSEAANHDKWVAGLSPECVVLAAGDLCKGSYNPSDKHLTRWERHRKAALLRRIDREKLIEAVA